MLSPETPNAVPTDPKGDQTKPSDIHDPVEMATPAPTAEPHRDLAKEDHKEVLEPENTI